MNEIKLSMFAALACLAGLAYGQGAVLPKELFDAKAAGCEKQLLIGGRAEGQVETKVVANGFEVTLTPGAAQWPGVMVVPAGGKPSWDLSLYGHVVCKLTNTGKTAFNLGMRVDNAAIPGKSPWNTEMIKLGPGASTMARVYFGYSFYFQPNYPLNAAEVVRVQFFNATAVKEPLSFRVEELKASGFAGEKPGTNPDLVRIRPKDGVVAENLRVDFETGADKARTVKPAQGFWDLSADMAVEVSVKNVGKTAARPGFSVSSDYGATDVYWSEKAVPAGGEAKVRVPFAPKKPWRAKEDPAQSDATKGGRWDRQPGTGTPFRNHKVNGFSVWPDPAVKGAQSFLVKRAASVNPPAKKPKWLGTRPPVPGNWVKTLDEEFEGTELNRKLFNVRWFNWWDKRQHWSDASVIVRDGKVTLRAERKRGFHNDNPDEQKFPGTLPDHPIETDWQTGWLDTFGKWAQRYGYWEFRMKLPTAPCMWSGVWTMPDRGLKQFPDGWPARNWNGFRDRTATDKGGMEFDIVETQSIWGPHRFNAACHWDGYKTEHKSLGTNCNYVETDEEGYITIGMLWLPGKLVFYGNGVEYWRWESSRVASVPMYIQFQHQFGGWETENVDPAQMPCDFKVDYVRIWQLKELASPDDGFITGGATLYDGRRPPEK